MIIDGYIAELMRNDVVKDTVTGNSTSKSFNVPSMQGWICPVCGSGLSPYVSVCPCKGFKGWDKTWQSGKGEENAEIH